MFRVAIIFLIHTTAAMAEPVSGKARVKDGDTIEIRSQSIRLEGIDAPEKKQPCTDGLGKSFDCGQAVAKVLTEFIKGREIGCEPNGTDKNGRVLAYCFLPDGVEINSWLVAAGYAFAFVEYSDRYVPHEARAKAIGAGLWNGRFSYPWCHRDAEEGKPCRGPDAFDQASPLPRPVGDPKKALAKKPSKGNPLGILNMTSDEFDCAPKYCKQMRSCKEARYHFEVCGDGDLDRDDDGVPCENVCGKH